MGAMSLRSGKCEKIHIQLLNGLWEYAVALCGICHHYGAVPMSEDDFLFMGFSLPNTLEM